jgi:hypothetical protein
VPGNVFSVCEDTTVFERVRAATNLPEWMQSIERVVEGSAKGRKRLAAMQGKVGK